MGRWGTFRFLLRRLAYGLLVLVGVNVLTFVLFFSVNTPDDMARLNIGGKRVSHDQIEKWKAERGYDKPLWLNHQARGTATVTDTVFWDRSVSLFALDFGRADSQGAGDIGEEIGRRMVVSLQLAMPVLLLELLATAALALVLVALRGTVVDFWGGVLCVVLFSISTLFYIVLGQLLFSRVLRLAPMSGYAAGWSAVPFLLLPVALSVLARLGGGTRLYRALFLEELGRPYVTTARAKGLPEWRVLTHHVLRNAWLPILTGLGAALPYVFMGSLVFEGFFGLPGLGAYVIDAIGSQDFAIVRSMVFLGALLHVVAYLLVDLAYAWADPRVRLA